MRPALNQSRRRFSFGLCCAAVASESLAQVPTLSAPNVVPIHARLVTSGQLTSASLAGAAAMGFEAVIYLAPPTVPDAVRDEGAILQRQGIEFVNIPIAFDNPTATDVDAFFRAMGRLRERTVLVHCQVNMRASSLVFLYRVIVLKEAPDAAYEAVSRVWSPRGPWRRLIVDQLRANQIAFDPY